jgi:hypothetical protein
MMMRFVLPLAAALVMAGCGRADDAGPLSSGFGKTHDRYVGIGIVAKNQLWAHLTATRAEPVDPSAATLDDDQHMIVVVDSLTGEVRQCGDLSGICVTMNPWGKSKNQPVSLTKHAADLTRKDSKR